MRAHLQVTDLTATFRGDNPERPVHVGYDGTRVVVVADPKHAELLAHIIGRASQHLHDGDDFDQALWDHVTVDLIASATMAGPRPEPATATPLEVVR